MPLFPNLSLSPNVEAAGNPRVFKESSEICSPEDQCTDKKTSYRDRKGGGCRQNDFHTKNQK